MSSYPESTSSISVIERTSQLSSMASFNISSLPHIGGNNSLEDFVTMSPDNETSIVTSLEPPLPEPKLSVAYTISESIVSLLAMAGNALVVYIFCKNRSLRRYRNYYIVALAIADFLVGLLGIPFAILASVGLPRNLYGCLFTVSILMVLCTVSIFCLVAVSIDRYWATTNPFAYYRNMTTTTAVSIILFCWVAGAIIGFLPLFGWYNRDGWERHPPGYCFFTDVMDYNYLVFLYFSTIVFPMLLMIGFYGYIYHVVLIKIRQKGTLAPQHLRRFSEQSRTGSLNGENRSATQVLRIMVSEKRREAKAAKKLGIIVVFFMLCWMPLYTINCIQAFYPDFYVPIELLNVTIILSHANSALNPFLYAYHLKEFRMAMKHALLTLCGKLCCGLFSAHMEKEFPLGAMSRSLTMPSVGHLTTIQHHTSGGGSGGKVSIKFRKIGHNDSGCRSAQISPSIGKQAQLHSRNLNNSAMMIPMVVSSNSISITPCPPSRENLVCGQDKSLTSLSLTTDSVKHIAGMTANCESSGSIIKNHQKRCTPGCYHKYTTNGVLKYNHQLSMPSLSLTMTSKESCSENVEKAEEKMDTQSDVCKDRRRSETFPSLNGQICGSDMGKEVPSLVISSSKSEPENEAESGENRAVHKATNGNSISGEISNEEKKPGGRISEDSTQEDLRSDQSNQKICVPLDSSLDDRDPTTGLGTNCTSVSDK